MKIHPAILVTSLTDYLLQISALAPVTKFFDIDIIDWERTDTSTLSVDEALKVKGDFSLNFDLMMDHPKKVIKKLLNDERVKYIIINLECKDNISELIDLIHHYKKMAGISLNPDNNFKDVLRFVKLIDIVQIYTVEPGKQGGSFIKSRLDLIDSIKKAGFNGLIEIDGGVNFKTIDLIKTFPIDIISVGSTLSKADNPLQAYENLKKEILN